MLRTYQQTALTDTQNFLRYRNGNGIAVLPCASGKSHIIAAIAEWITDYDDCRVLVLANRKELLEQNGDKFEKPERVGYVSAGMGKFEYDKQIVVAGIQTAYNKVEKLGKFKVIIIDECDSVSNNKQDNSIYWQLLNEYPDTRVIGLTATPYRTEDGPLTWGYIYHITPYRSLFDQGFLSPLTNKVPLQPDLSKVKVVMGDYVISQAAKIMMEPTLLEESIKRTLYYGKDKDFWLIFASSIDHAQLLHKALHENNIHTLVLTNGCSKTDREYIINQARDGDTRCLINVNMATIGVDIPRIDMIAVMRPTNSRRLHEQMLGRGCRLHPDKENCLILDFAGNLKEHGGLGDDSWSFEKGKIIMKEDNTHKVCPRCEESVVMGTEICPECNHIFIKEEPRQVYHNQNIDDKSSVIGATEIKEAWRAVTSVKYRDYTSKKSGNRMVKVEYYCGNYFKVQDFFLLNNKNMQWKYKPWLKQVLPDTWQLIAAADDKIEEFLGWSDDAIAPKELRVRKLPHKYPEIMEKKYA